MSTDRESPPAPRARRPRRATKRSAGACGFENLRKTRRAHAFARDSRSLVRLEAAGSEQADLGSRPDQGAAPAFVRDLTGRRARLGSTTDRPHPPPSPRPAVRAKPRGEPRPCVATRRRAHDRVGPSPRPDPRRRREIHLCHCTHLDHSRWPTPLRRRTPSDDRASGDEPVGTNDASGSGGDRSTRRTMRTASSAGQAARRQRDPSVNLDESAGSSRRVRRNGSESIGIAGSFRRAHRRARSRNRLGFAMSGEGCLLQVASASAWHPHHAGAGKGHDRASIGSMIRSRRLALVLERHRPGLSRARRGRAGALGHSSRSPPCRATKPSISANSSTGFLIGPSWRTPSIVSSSAPGTQRANLRERYCQ